MTAAAPAQTILREPAAGEPTVSVLVAGDVAVPTGRLPAASSPVGLWPDLESVIAGYDVSWANLECPLAPSPEGVAAAKFGPRLLSEPRLAGLLRRGGFRGVTLANNHIADAGPQGVVQTVAACRQAGLVTVGAGADRDAAEQPALQTAAGLRVATLAFAEREFNAADAGTPGAAILDPWRSARLVRECRDSADVVLVVLHVGTEMVAVPRPGLIETCRGLIQAGADAVVCHHTHIPSGVEVYRGSPIVYGTGNLLFPAGDVNDRWWWRGYMVGLTFAASGPVSFRLLPTVCERGPGGGWEARPLTGEPAQEVLRHVAEVSAVIADPVALERAWRAVAERQRRYYLGVLLGLTRIERRLLRYGVWPWWRRRRRTLPALFDYVVCDSHRELATRILDEEMRRSG